jgi:Xaa-Pro aminopeptidase
VSNDGQLSADELVLLDVGAECDHYAADLTRTVSMGSPSRRQQLVYDAVLEVHAHAIGLLKPGVILKEYEKQVEAFMGECLRELGLIKSIDPEAVRTFYPHSTSHFLGLTAHDAGLYDQPLEAGMVLTVEPGIYIADEALGIRVEDDVLITNDGNRMLSDRLLRELV